MAAVVRAGQTVVSREGGVSQADVQWAEEASRNWLAVTLPHILITVRRAAGRGGGGGGLYWPAPSTATPFHPPPPPSPPPAACS
jgi:hypothetical protein